MEYGEILARTYQLPQRQQAAPMGVQRQPKERKAEDFDFAKIPGLDKAPEGLEYSRPDIAQQTQRYYQDWADLRNFAKTMWVKYGVDVTAPDPGNQDSIWASEAFNQRLGLLMSGVNEAKLGQKAFEERQRLIAEGKITERPDAAVPQGYSAGYGLEQQYSPVFAESPESKNVLTGVQNLTPAQVAQANALKDQTVAEFERLAKDAYSRGDKLAGDNFTQQANYTRTKQVYAAENAPSWQFGQGSQVMALTSKVAALAKGIDSSFQDTGIVDTKTGRKIYASTANPIVQQTTERIGGKPVVRVDYVGGKIRLLNEDALKPGGYVPENYKEYDPDTDFYNLLQPAVQGVGLQQELERLAPELQRMGVMSVDGRGQMTLDATKMLSEREAAALPQFQAADPNLSQNVVQAKEQLRSRLTEMLKEDKWFQRQLAAIKGSITGKGVPKELAAPPTEASFDLPTAAGYKIQVTPIKKGNSKGFYAAFIKDDGTPYMQSGKPVESTFDNEEDLINFLDRYNAFNNMILQPQGTAQLTERQQRAIQAFKAQYGRDPNEAETQAILNKYK